MAHRIDEIKERINKYREEEWSYASDDIPDWSHEVEYLISRLEIAEKALEKVVKNGNTDVNGEDAENMLIMCGDISQEALQQIRS